MRVFLNKTNTESYFNTLKEFSNLSWEKIAKRLDINTRMLRSYRAGKYSIPYSVATSINKEFGIDLPEEKRLLKSYWNNKQAGRIGGFKRNKLYGNPGTAEGRRKGGIRSLKSNRLRMTNFKFRKTIKKPKKSTKLAELIGILMGDGGITKMQVRITLDKDADHRYSKYVKSLIEELFGIKITQADRNSTIELVASSISMVEYLKSEGLPIGNKIKSGIDFPKWIRQNSDFYLACIRGVFDTDGCTYLDQHRYKYKTYRGINICITSASKNLLSSITDLLRKEGYHPTTSSRRSVRLRRNKEVVRFFSHIGSKNFKHLVKYKRYLPGEVSKRT